MHSEALLKKFHITYILRVLVVINFATLPTLLTLPTFWGCVFFKILQHYLHYLHSEGVCFQNFATLLTLPTLPTFWGRVFFKIVLHYLHYQHYLYSKGVCFQNFATLPTFWGCVFFKILQHYLHYLYILRVCVFKNFAQLLTLPTLPTF